MSNEELQPPQNFRVRRCNHSDDAEQIYRLTRAQAIYEKSLDEMETSLEDFRRDGFERDPPLFYAALAERHNPHDNRWHAVGFAMFFLSYSSWKGRSLYLEEIFVDEQFRGKGLGTRLMEHAVNAAIELDCARLQWVVLDWNVSSIKFYEAAGATLLPEWKLMRFDKAGLTSYAVRAKQRVDST